MKENLTKLGICKVLGFVNTIIMDSNVIVWWPNTREVFKGKNKFILVNKKYPGRWRMFLEKIFSKDNMVVSVVRVESEYNNESFYATSFFVIKNDLICEITEYWGKNEEPPEWRNKENLSERY